MSTRYLPLEVVLRIVAAQGWQLKDPGLMDSALKRPMTTVFGQDAYPTLGTKAAAMMYSIAQNQALVDGNKRLALLCTHIFAGLNDHEIGAGDDIMYTALGVDIPQGLDDVAEIARRLALRPRSPQPDR